MMCSVQFEEDHFCDAPWPVCFVNIASVFSDNVGPTTLDWYFNHWVSCHGKQPQAATQLFFGGLPKVDPDVDVDSPWWQHVYTQRVMVPSSPIFGGFLSHRGYPLSSDFVGMFDDKPRIFWGSPIYGSPLICRCFFPGCSMTWTIQILGYPDLRKTKKNIKETTGLLP